ncbi:unnamed protein product [Aphanomyces euteiches]
MHFARVSVRLSSGNSALLHAVHEANLRPFDAKTQLQTLQLLEAVNPSPVVQRVQKHHFVMCPNSQRVYANALARTTCRPHNFFSSSISNSSRLSSDVSSVVTGSSDLSSAFWPIFGTLVWTCAAATSVVCMTQNEGRKEEKPIRATSIPAMQWNSTIEPRPDENELPARRSSSIASKIAMWALEYLHAEAFEEPYEHLADIRTE